MLRKALELQDRAPSDDGPEGGLTLEEMQAIAREVGLEPEMVARAAGLLTKGDEALSTRILGGPTRLGATHRFDRELESEDASRIVGTIRRVMEHEGEVQDELGGVRWKSVGEVTQTFVSLRPDAGATEVRVRVDRGVAFLMTWFFTILVFLILAGATGEALAPGGVLGGILYFLGFLTAGAASARLLWSRSSRLVEARLQRLLDAVDHEMSEIPKLPAGDEPPDS